MMMKQRLFIWLLSLLAMSANAVPTVSRQQAMAKAKAFLEQRRSHGAKTRADQSVSLVSAETGVAHIYAFNASDGGFVLVSDGDSAPVLGYADTGHFDGDDLPPALKRLMESYDTQMPVASTRADDAIWLVKTDIQPMVKAKWAQQAPYNNKIPILSGASERSPVGCVATAMAEVLYYYQWPKRITRTISAYTDHPALEPVDFNWKAMKDTNLPPSTKEADEAVATLLQYCAYALRTSFGTVDASSNTEWLYMALYRYFSFDKNSLSILNRSEIDDNEFFNTIYSELSEGRPVIMGGDQHEFVCDGYQSGDYFHINWGWDGKFDGYYLLDTHTRSDKTNFSKAKHFPDEALIGIKKTSEPYSGELTTQLTTSALQLAKPIAGAYTRKGDTDFPTIDLHYGVADYCADTSEKTFDAGLALYKNGAFQKVIFEMKDVMVEDNNREHARAASITFGQGLADGSYDILPVSRKTGSSEWLLNEEYSPVYLRADIAGEKMTLTACPRNTSYIVNNITFEGKLMAGEPVKATVNVTNPNQDHFQTTFVFCGGKAVGVDPDFAYCYGGLAAGETKDLIFEFTPKKAGTYTCYMWNDKCFYGDGVELVIKPKETPYTIDGKIKLTCSAKTEFAETKGQENYLYGHVLNSVVTFKNPSADKAFSGELSAGITLQGEGGDSIDLDKKSLSVFIEPNGSCEIPLYTKELQTGSSYALYATNEADEDPLVIYYISMPAISAYLSDGTIKTDRNVTDYTVPEKALCVELGGQGVTKITPNANPNCLYILSDTDALPQGITEKNVIRYGDQGVTAEELELNDDYEMMTPLAFTAKRASYVRTFKAQECEGYTTLALPFTATAITANNQPVGLRLSEFTSDQPGKVFISELSGGMPQGGIPYLVELTDKSLAGQPVTFTGQNTDVYETYLPLAAGSYKFIGSSMATKPADTIEIFTFDAGKSGTSLPQQKACAAFRAYFRSLLFPGQYKSLSIEKSTTGISTVVNTPSASEAVYDLQGRRINGQPARGIYIQGNRKMTR